MISSHKRSSLDRDTTFYAPKVACFACYDSGIVSNGDGLLNDYLTDYDATVIDGVLHRHGGSDLAIICHCTAAYESQDFESQTTRSGFRDSSGVKSTDINGRQQAIGVDPDKDIIREIHRKRRDLWQRSAQDLNSLRQQVRAGMNPQLPDYIATVKQQLQGLNELLPAFASNE
jgi:hypothetical protein